MSTEEEKWAPYFSQHSRYHGNQDNLFLAYFDYFFSEKGSIYSGCTDKPLSEIYVMVILHKSIRQVLSAANEKFLQIGVVRQHVTLTCT